MSPSLTMAIIPYSKPLTNDEFVKSEFEKMNKSCYLLLPCSHKVGQEVVAKINELAKRQNKKNWTQDFSCPQCSKKVSRIRAGQLDVILSRADEELRRIAKGPFPRPFPDPHEFFSHRKASSFHTQDCNNTL